MDIKGIIEEMLNEIDRERERGGKSGLCTIAHRVLYRTHNDYCAFCALIEKEAIDTIGKIRAGYWFYTSDDSIEAWYAPRIAFLRKWLDDLNNN
jgi:hypothetical protein